MSALIVSPDHSNTHGKRNSFWQLPFTIYPSSDQTILGVFAFRPLSANMPQDPFIPIGRLTDLAKRLTDTTWLWHLSFSASFPFAFPSLLFKSSPVYSWSDTPFLKLPWNLILELGLDFDWFPLPIYLPIWAFLVCLSLFFVTLLYSPFALSYCHITMRFRLLVATNMNRSCFCLWFYLYFGISFFGLKSGIHNSL